MYTMLSLPLRDLRDAEQVDAGRRLSLVTFWRLRVFCRHWMLLYGSYK